MKPVLKKFEFEIKRVGSVEDDRIIKETAGELSRLVYTSGSPYQQDRSCAYAPFGGIKAAGRGQFEKTSQKSVICLRRQNLRGLAIA